MIVSAYQNKPEFGRMSENIDRLLKAVDKQDFDILILPELFAVGYQFLNRREAISLAEPAGDGETYERISALARQKKALVIYGFPERDKGEHLYNSSLAVYPDGSFRLYRKTHLFDTEKEIFDPGDTGFSVFDFRGTRLGMMICFDWRFPEAARKLTLLGAQIICHPSNLVLPHCPEAMVTRVLENRVFAITADRVGQESRTGTELRFIGRSRIIAPDGIVLAEADNREEAFISAEIDPQVADNKDVTSRNNIFQDRRPEFY